MIKFTTPVSVRLKAYRKTKKPAKKVPLSSAERAKNWRATHPKYYRDRRIDRKLNGLEGHNGRFCYLQVIQILRRVYDD